MPGHADNRSFEAYCFVLLPGLFVLSFSNDFYGVILVGITSALSVEVTDLTFKYWFLFFVCLLVCRKHDRKPNVILFLCPKN